MADKKITELSSLQAISQDDLFVVVDDPLGTPITKNITAAGLFSNVGFSQATNTTSAISALNVVTVAGTANISNQVSGAKVSLVIGNSAVTQLSSGVVGNNGPYGLSIEHSNTVGRTANAQPMAFVNFSESFSGNTTHSTKYLLDVGKNGNANVTANLTANLDITALFGTANNLTATHKLRIRVNGEDYWVLLANSSRADGTTPGWS